MILLALGHAVTQLGQKRVDDASGFCAVPQCYDDLMARRCKGDIKNVADVQLTNHRCFRRCKLGIELKGFA
ncbi:hypothetical protein D9M71_666660 [compost metagenome]